MDTKELIAAAAAIAGALATRSFDTGGISPGKIQEVASTAVKIARAIEKEATSSTEAPG